METFRLRSSEDMVSEYQVMASVGGKQLWMQLETMTATTWVVSAACFTPGCQATPLFGGMFIPFIPPAFVKQDMLRAGLTQMGAIFGFLGHSFVDLAGQNVIGAPIMMGIIDLGMVLGGGMSYNHSGAIGLGFWEDNLPNWFIPKDPGLDIIKFMMCGNIFFPIPGAPVPIMKPFMLWGIPWYLPSGLVFKFSFYYGDRGGCFFLDPGMGAAGEETFYSEGGLKWIVVMPVAVKFLLPSWLFLLSDAKVNGKSVKPCIFGVCKASVHTGQFSITGPRTPVLKMLEEVAAPKDCTRLDVLPDMSFTLMGTEFTLSRNEYVVYADAFGEKECLTALTPDGTLFGLLEPLSMWIFGDAWVRSFYTVFELVPLKRIGFSKADHRYYEKNGCVCGSGEGPIDSVKPLEQGERELKEEEARIGNNREMRDKVETLGWKRAQNWKDDLEGMRRLHDAMGTDTDASAPCDSGMRFKSGKCLPQKMVPEVRAMQRFRETWAEWGREDKAKREAVAAEQEGLGPKVTLAKVKPQFYMSPERERGQAENVDTSKPPLLDSAGNPMVRDDIDPRTIRFDDSGTGAGATEAAIVDNTQLRPSLKTAVRDGYDDDDEGDQLAEDEEHDEILATGRALRELSASVFLEQQEQLRALGHSDAAPFSAPAHNWGPFERHHRLSGDAAGTNMCSRADAEAARGLGSEDVQGASAHEGLFHTTGTREPHISLLEIDEQTGPDRKAKGEENSEDADETWEYWHRDGRHKFVTRARREVEEALAKHGVGKRHEHGNHADSNYVEFVEVATQLLASHHANAHSQEGLWTKSGQRVTLTTEILDEEEEKEYEEAAAAAAAAKRRAHRAKRMKQLYHNASQIFDAWRDDLNITEQAMRSYWRGQDEDWIADAREAAMDLWEERIQRARRTIGASKVKAAINKRALERALKEVPAGYDVASLEQLELARLDGRYMNDKDGWGTQEPYYPFFDKDADKKMALTEGDKVQPIGAGADTADSQRFAETNTEVLDAPAEAARRASRELKRMRKLRIIREWAQRSLQDYPELWAHHEAAMGEDEDARAAAAARHANAEHAENTTVSRSLEWEALHLQEAELEETAQGVEATELRKLKRSRARTASEQITSAGRNASADVAKDAVSNGATKHAKRATATPGSTTTRTIVNSSAGIASAIGGFSANDEDATEPERLVLGQVNDADEDTTNEGDSENPNGAPVLKRTRMVRNGDGSLTQEVADGDDFAARRKRRANALWEREEKVAEAQARARAHPKLQQKQDVRTAYSLIERKFDHHREVATKKLAELEDQLARMRVQHEHRQSVRKERKEKVKKNRKRLRGD